MTSDTRTAAETPLARIWIPAALLVLFAAQSLWFIHTQSLTYDEPAHIIAGVEAWQQGRFEHWNDHPPLGRLWLTLPLARAHAEFQWQPLSTGFRVTFMQPAPQQLAWRTRPMNTALGVLLGIALWFAACRLFSTGAANVALALYAFTPSLIANFSIATTDGIGALFIFLVAWQLVRWRHTQTTAQNLLLGLVLGGLLLSKFYAPPLVLLALGFMLVLDREQGLRPTARWNWKAALLALAVALVTLWAGYFFHVARLHVANGQVAAEFPNRPLKTWATKSQVTVNTVVPAGEFLEGLREVALSNRRGRPSWFLGSIYPTGGIKAYYPVAIALKWPTVVLLLFLLSLIFGVHKSARSPGDLLVMSLFAIVYLIFAVQSKYDIGERHILPLYPFALLIAGGIWERARGHRLGIAALVLALCLNAADALRCAPDYLAYFNLFVPQSKSWLLLTDSNLDWGQGLLAVRMYEEQHPQETVHLAYFGSVDPSLYGVHASPLDGGEPSTGTLIVGATCLSGQVLEDPSTYRWLWRREPYAILDSSMWVYRAAQP